MPDAQALADELRGRIAGEVRFDDGSRALYATDASNYRQVPVGVVIPRTVNDVIETMAACRRHGAPVLSRGCGTSLAGQCCNVAVVIDFSKYLNRIIALDPAGAPAPARSVSKKEIPTKSRSAAARGCSCPPSGARRRTP